MKTRLPKLAKCPTTARNVLECGAAAPLSLRRTIGSERLQNPNGIPSQSLGLSTLRSRFEVGFTLGVAATEDGRGTSYPGKECLETQQPQRGCGVPGPTDDTTPLGLRPILSLTQGSSCLATLGWRTQSLWDWCQTRVLFTALFLSVLCSPAFAQFSIDWFTIDGGGGTSTGGVYSVSGTVGQPDASAQPMTGGNFSLIGGFWALFAVQTPDAPLLTIRLTPTNTAIVSWPSPSTGFLLQQNADLNTANWVTDPQSVTDNGTNRFIIVNPPAGNRFYRLFKP